MKNTATFREIARQGVIDSVSDAATKMHERNYKKLHINRDGTVSWFECINKSDDLIDGKADGFQAIRSVVTVGTGSTDCNCDHCNEVYSVLDEKTAKDQGREYNADEKYQTYEDAIANAVGDSDLSELEGDMLSKLDHIEIGYFSDEIK